MNQQSLRAGRGRLLYVCNARYQVTVVMPACTYLFNVRHLTIRGEAVLNTVCMYVCVRVYELYLYAITLGQINPRKLLTNEQIKMI